MSHKSPNDMAFCKLRNNDHPNAKMKVSETDSYRSNFFSSTEKYESIGGIRVPEKKSKGYYVQLIYNWFFIVYGISTVLCEFLIWKDIVQDLDVFVKNLGMILIHVLGIVKAITFYGRDEKFKKMKSILLNEKYEYVGFRDFHPEDGFYQQRKTLTLMIIILGALAIGVGLTGYIAAMISIHSVNATDGYFPENVTCVSYMPYPCHTIIEINSISGCKLAMFLYFIGLEIFGLEIVAFDVTYAAYLCCVKAHFLSIGGAFRTVRERCLLNLGYSPDEIAFKDEHIEQLEETMMVEIRNNTIHLQAILGVCEDIENLFGDVILIQILLSLMISAALLCATSSVDLLSAESFSTMQFYSAVMVEVSLYCYFGNELTLACDSIRLSIYEANWLSASERYKRYMMINICRLQKPVYITTGKFSPLTLQTLVAVARASFSVFTLYRSVIA